MIKEAYVSFEVAKLLKEKGFLIVTPDWYYVNGEWEHHNSVDFQNNNIDNIIPACTQQIAMRWLRENYDLHVCPEYKAFFQERPKKLYYRWCCKIVGINRSYVYDADYFFIRDAKTYHDTFEEACEECIKFALEYLIEGL